MSKEQMITAKKTQVEPLPPELSAEEAAWL